MAPLLLPPAPLALDAVLDGAELPAPVDPAVAPVLPAPVDPDPPLPADEPPAPIRAFVSMNWPRLALPAALLPAPDVPVVEPDPEPPAMSELCRQPVTVTCCPPLDREPC